MQKKIFLTLLFLITIFSSCIEDYTFSKSLSIDINKISQIENIMPAVVIGSGPAGLSSALYLARAGLDSLVITGDSPGGQIIETTYVENWPGIKKQLGSEIIKNMREQATSFGVKFLNDKVTKVDFSEWPFKIFTEDGFVINALTVVISTGASVRKLNIPGMKEFWGKGITSCAICDAPFYEGKDVVVLGGGDSAVEEVLQLSSYAKNIYLIVRKDKMRAALIIRKRLSDLKNLKILYNTEVKEIIGNYKGINSIKVQEGNKTYDIPVSGVFLAIGRIPNTKIFKDSLALDPTGYIKVACNSQQTSIKGIFAAGDVEDSKFRQAVIASGKGAQAALEAIDFLGEIGFNEEMEKKVKQNYFRVEQSEKIKVIDILTKDDLSKELNKEKKLVVVDFWAPWCPSCLKMIPVVESVCAKFQDKVKMLKVDTSKSLELAQLYSVSTIPALLFFKDGKLVERKMMEIGKKELINTMSKLSN